MFEKFQDCLSRLYRELTAVHESPHRVSLSFAMGIFLGILPFTGVIASIALAWAFRLNKAAAILGSAITNTWLGLIVLGLSVKIGAVLTNSNGKVLQDQLDNLWKHFSWQTFQQTNFLPLFLAVALGYVVLSLVFAVVGYCIARFVISWHQKPRA